MVCKQINIDYIFLIVFQLSAGFVHSITLNRLVFEQFNVGAHHNLPHIKRTTYDLVLLDYIPFITSSITFFLFLQYTNQLLVY
jgi:hypothetical protein